MGGCDGHNNNTNSNSADSYNHCWHENLEKGDDDDEGNNAFNIICGTSSIMPSITGVAINTLDDDVEKDDPRTVDEILCMELLSLSLKERNDIQEEIHCVKCLAVNETSELINTSLKELHRVLESDEDIPHNEKCAYIQSQKLIKSSSTYINSNEFRLRFLRCELFNVKKAALRMVKILDLMVELFGIYALWRPINMNDFNKDELRELRKGHYQLLPYRDRVGRRVFCLLANTEWESMKPLIKAKIAFYTLFTAGYDIETQRRGAVVIVWYIGDSASASSSSSASASSSSSASSENKKTTEAMNIPIYAKMHSMTSIRASAIHMCTPDTLHFRDRRSIMTMIMCGHNRSRLKIHVGESEELLYRLQGFGIATDTLPFTSTGKIKTIYLKQWMKLRMFLEQPLYNYNQYASSPTSASASESTSNTNRATFLVECPQLNDVVFRQGTNAMYHPGNVQFRSLIESKQEHDEQLHQQKNQKNVPYNTNRSISWRPIKEIVTELMDDVKRNNGRFLIWNDSKDNNTAGDGNGGGATGGGAGPGGGCWFTLIDKKQIYHKIEYVVRMFRYEQKKNSSSSNSNSNSIQQQQQQQQQVNDNENMDNNDTSKRRKCSSNR